MSDLEARVFAAFQVEYPEHLQHLRALVATLEGGGQPDTDKALRHAHNLKGAARAVDLRAIETLAHRLETVFSLAGKGVLVLDAEAGPVLHQVLDSMEDWIVQRSRGNLPDEPVSALEAIDRFLSGQESGVAPPAAPPPPPVAEPAKDPPAPAEDTMRVAASRVDRLLGTAGQMMAEGLRQELILKEIAHLRSDVDELSREWQRSVRQNHGRGRVEAHLQSLSRRVRRVYRMQVESRWAVERGSRKLHADVRRILLVPARTVFEGFPRLVRDLSRSLEKSIEFDMQGIEVQADRRVLQALKDPIVHLLRNAAGHGIEPAADRVARGKLPVGRIGLQVQTRGSRLVVRIEDDGRGIDFARVAQIAVKRGLLSEAEASGASTSEMGRFLFLPGFSTSQVLTEVAGRGIGLSVVQEALGLLGGEVQTESVAGAGAAFVLTVPLSLSMQSLFMVQSQGQSFALPSSGLERLHRLAPTAMQTVEGHPVVPTPTGPIPLWNLSHLLYRDGSPPTARQGFMSVAIIKSTHRRLAVAVDAFTGHVDGVLQSLGPVQPPGLRATAGMVLGDGSICLVLNPNDLLELAREAPPPQTLAEVPTPARTEPTERPCVLVVDDSFTTRTLEKGILESSGYQVRVAVDGVDALHVLRSERVDLIIADVQMPRMDGFELLTALKSDARLARLPVILVTSLERREDQERGLSLGADAYIVKRKFEQRDLLETVRQLL